MTVGDGEDLPQRADMCINEIYDSALLGEACLPAFRHALANLLVSGRPTRPQVITSYHLGMMSTAARTGDETSGAFLLTA